MVQALVFLRNVKDEPEDYDITGDNHVKGVRAVRRTLVERFGSPGILKSKIFCNC